MNDSNIKLGGESSFVVIKRRWPFFGSVVNLHVCHLFDRDMKSNLYGHNLYVWHLFDRDILTE